MILSREFVGKTIRWTRRLRFFIVKYINSTVYRTETSKWFIENSRQHAEIIMEQIAARVLA